MKNRIRKDLINLMQLPGLSGYEDRVRKDLNQKLKDNNYYEIKNREKSSIAYV